MMHYLLILLIGYLLGCSNMAVYLAAAQNIDLCSGGSGNPRRLQRADPNGLARGAARRCA